MITIKNRQRSYKIDLERLKRDAQRCLDFFKYSDFDLGILLTTDKTIREYNRDYRGKDKPTDILSFSAYPELKPGQRIKVCCPDDQNLGDLVISVAYVARIAKKRNIPLDDHLRTLLVHGFCHLLGYDHECDADFKTMRKKELALLRVLNY